MMEIETSGLNKIIASAYHLLNLVTYITTGEEETKAWTISKGTLAPQAAAVIHSDFEKRFIRAEIVTFKDLETFKSMNKCKEQGLVRTEGKHYQVQDGDVCLFKLNQ